jgi:PKD repeat protein
MKALHSLYGKKLWVLPILLLLALSLLAALNVNITRVSAVVSPYIAVVPETIEDVTLTPGTNFTVSIDTDYVGTFEFLDYIWGYQFALSYNPNVINGVEVVNGDLIVGGSAKFMPGPFDNVAGELSLTVGVFKEGGEVTSGPGTLANVTFTVVGKGASDITIDSAPLERQSKLVGWNWEEDPHDYDIINAAEHPDQIQHGYFDNRFQDDVAVVNVTAQAEAAVGSLVSINVTVANIGKSSENVEVAVSYNTTHIDSQNVTLLKEESETVSFSWDITGLAQGNYTINATATIEEDLDITDNWNTTTFLVAHDVAVVSLVAPDTAAVESLVPISVEVVNEGSVAEVANVTVRYDTTYIDSQNVTLGPGENETVLFSWDTTGLAQGNYTINATATIEDDGDQNDNWNTTKIRLVAYDVAVKSILVPPAKAASGDIVPINVTVANEGAFRAVANVTVRYNLTLISFNDTVELPVGESETVSFSWDTTDVKAGTYTINATARLMNKTDTWTAGINNTDAWTGNGTQTTFVTTGKPVVPDSEKVYVNQTLMTKLANYTIDYGAGNITFTTAPGLGANVTATYLYLTKSFVTTGKPVVPDSEKVYVNQTLMTKLANYTIDYGAGNITFTTAPGFGAEIKAIYLPVDMDPADNWNATTILIVEHDVAVGSVNAPATAIPGDIVSIDVEVENIGASAEVANVTVRYDLTLIGFNGTVVLPAQNSTIVSFSWNTTGVAQGDYIINATAIIPVDEDPADNWNATTILIAKHDVAILSITAPPWVEAGQPAVFWPLTKNFGLYNETFEVKVAISNDTTVVEVQTKNITLHALAVEEAMFSWNTVGVAPDSYTIKVEAILATDEDLANNNLTKSILVIVPPVASFTFSPTELVVDEVVTFNASSSYDADPGGEIVSYAWNFGDGTQKLYIDANLTDITTHAYTSTGTYTVTLNVTDGEGLTDTATAQVTVLLHDIAVTGVTPLPTTVKTGEPVSINVTVVNEGTEKETFNVTVYYDDTAIGTQTVTELASDASKSLTFNWDTTDVTAGTYTIKASATTVPGETDTTDNTYTDGDVTLEEATAVDILPYAAAAGATAIVIAAAAIYFLKIRKPKPT